MRTSRALVLSVSVVAMVGALLSAPVVSQAATAPTAPYTMMSIEGSPGGFLANGTRLFDSGVTMPNPPSFGAYEFDAEPSTGPALSVSITPPTGTSLAVGTYVTAAQADVSHLGLYIISGNGGCSTFDGTVQIEQVATGAGGALTQFAASYTTMCDGNGPFWGEIRWNSSVTYQVPTTSPTSIDFGSADIDSTPVSHTVTISNQGTAPEVISGPATLSGDAPDSFAISNDTCNAATLNFGDTCTVDVADQPQTDGAQQTATLVIPDNSRAGHRTVSLAVQGQEPSTGTFYSIPGHRILDTRVGTGVRKGAVPAGGSIRLKVTGKNGVPSSGVSAVVLNLTETAASSAGYATVFPTGQPRPTASTINYLPAVNRANMVTVQVGSGGDVDFFNSGGHVQLIADITGWYAADDSALNTVGLGQSFQTVDPERMLDTRQWKPAGLKSGYEAPVAIHFDDPYNDSVTAFVVTVTAVKPTAGGYVTAFQDGQNPTASSTLNLQPGVTTPNLAIVPTTTCTDSWCSGDQMMWVYNGSPKTVNLLVDLVGFYASPRLSDGLRYHPINPTRIVDTRTPGGVLGPLAAGSTHSVLVPPTVADTSTWAVNANVTAIAPTASTYLSLWPDFAGDTKPDTSNLNPSKGAVVANAVVTGIGDDYQFNIFNSAGQTNVAIDISGTFDQFPAAVAQMSRRASQSASGATNQAAQARAKAASVTGAPPAQSYRGGSAAG